MLCLIALGAKAQHSFYQKGIIQKIEVFISDPNWDYKLDTAANGAEGYLLIDSVRINGANIDSVGIKYKGNSSYDSSILKNPIHIALDEFTERTYQGIADIKLSNCYSDPSMIREVLAYDMLSNYMDCPQSNFAQLYINGNLIGLYSNDESINKAFCSKVFNSNQNTFIKCNPLLNPGPNTKSNLKYLGSDTASYFNFYEIKSKKGWQDLVKLCDTVSNYQASLASIFDIDRLMWMLAFNNLIVNLDSYSGVFCQNYYLYRNLSNTYSPIVWDLNMAYGGFPYLGAGNSSMGSLSVTNMQQLSPIIHATDTYWPLLNAAMNNSSWRKKYFAHLRTMESEMIANSAFITKATELQNTIDTAVLSDPNKFYSYQQFKDGLSANVVASNYTIPGISVLMNARSTYLNAQTEFKLQGPQISTPVPSNANPNLNETVWIKVTINNASNAVLNYRSNSYLAFQSVPLFDDGLHQDGVANDKIFGASLVQTDAQIQYYIYAENTDAGMFSPARAEHEFYSLNIPQSTVFPGELVINELLADNEESDVNEFGGYEDWIELYNTTDRSLSLANMYLSDNSGSLKKYAFPASTVIGAKQYLMIWADEGANTAKYLHANFKLSNNGESVFLSNMDGLILDSITYGMQEADKSFGRCPNGTGSFTQIKIPTFKESNVFCVTGINEKTYLPFNLYPNPSTGIVYYNSLNSDAHSIELYSIAGELVQQIELEKGKGSLNLSTQKPGLYFYSIVNSLQIPIKSGKIILTNAN